MFRGLVSILLTIMFALCISGCAVQTKDTPPDELKGAKSLNDLKEESFAHTKEIDESIKTGGENDEGLFDSPAGGGDEPSAEKPGDEGTANDEPVETDPTIDSVTGSPYQDLVAVVDTTKGTFKIKFWPDTAPEHVKNFIKLSRDGFYNGLTFHRYEPGFVIQGGDPEGTGSGGPGYNVPAEISAEHPHVKGAVAAARLPDQVNPKKESSGSQWYVCLEAAPFLDGEYTVWGQVIQGMDVVMKLRQGDKMNKIEIRKRQ